MRLEERIEAIEDRCDQYLPGIFHLPFSLLLMLLVVVILGLGLCTACIMAMVLPPAKFKPRLHSWLYSK